ncbi:hypothetical protein ACROYT_G027659 [Oculina patagonica]
MSFVVKLEDNSSRYLLGEESSLSRNEVFRPKKSNRRPHLFEFMLDILSEPRYSSIISWEGTSGQFKIIKPDMVACLWGERNGRENMTYQKFSRALRYYYHKNVLTKIRGRKYTYKFEFRELERQYGYQKAPPPPTQVCGLGMTDARFPPLVTAFVSQTPRRIFPPFVP